MITVLLDTNFILYALEKHIPLSSIKELFDQPAVLMTVPAVKLELAKMSTSKGKESVYARIALELNIPVVDVEGNYADEQLLNFLKEEGESALATNDYKLLNRAKKLGRRVVVIKKGTVGWG